MITRRTALLSITTAALSTTACGSLAPMDEKEVTDAVAQIDGVTSVDIALEKYGVADWSLTGEIGLPDDAAEAQTVYENCLRAIASVPVDSGTIVGVDVYGTSASGQQNTTKLGLPDDTKRLKEHFN